VVEVAAGDTDQNPHAKAAKHEELPRANSSMCSPESAGPGGERQPVTVPVESDEESAVFASRLLFVSEFGWFSVTSSSSRENARRKDLPGAINKNNKTPRNSGINRS
jgi:hypothetical protein